MSAWQVQVTLNIMMKSYRVGLSRFTCRHVKSRVANVCSGAADPASIFANSKRGPLRRDIRSSVGYFDSRH